MTSTSILEMMKIRFFLLFFLFLFHENTVENGDKGDNERKVDKS